MPIKSLRWYTRLFAFHAVPLEGMTTRMWLTEGRVVAGILGPLTFYADREPDFASLAAHYLGALEKMPGGYTLSHSGAYFLRAAQYHLLSRKPAAIAYKPYAQLYQSDHSLYYLYGHRYQTAITLRGRKPLKGLQTWSYRGQPPLIFPTRQRQSFALGMGFDSHLMDVPWDVSPDAHKVCSLADSIQVLFATNRCVDHGLSFRTGYDSRHLSRSQGQSKS